MQEWMRSCVLFERSYLYTQRLGAITLLLSPLLWFACPAPAGDSMLAPCPDSPNCVNSRAADDRHGVAPFVIDDTLVIAWDKLRELLGRYPRTSVTIDRGSYLKAEVRSRLLGFVDDLEFEADGSAGVIHVRSASRTGYWDFGVNRRRVEELRKRLAAQGVIRP